MEEISKVYSKYRNHIYKKHFKDRSSEELNALEGDFRISVKHILTIPTMSEL